jgi:hypothetical protein
MPTPSLILVPARFKTGKLYTPLATTSGGVVLGASGDFNVTRATTATRFNSAGLIESVASGVPRLDYYTSGGTAGCPALLVEPSAQNLALRSEQFDVSGTWGFVTGGTGALPSVTANAVVSPDGTQNAETVLLNRGAGNAIGDQSTLQQTITLATSGTYTFSVYAKATASGDVGKQIFLRAGSAGDLIPYTLTANWVRLTRTQTGLASGSNIFQIGNRGTVTADNSVSVDLWGAQVETGSVATSYIPTTTASATRNADVVSVSGAVSGAIGQTEGTIYWDIAYVGGVLTGTGNPEFGVRNQALTNWIALTSNGPSAPFRINARTTGGVNLINYTANITSGKAALAWSSAGLVLYVNGVSVATSATNPNFSFSRADIGNTSTMPFKANAFALYTTRLTNTELAALTTL